MFGLYISGNLAATYPTFEAVTAEIKRLMADGFPTYCLAYIKDDRLPEWIAY